MKMQKSSGGWVRVGGGSGFGRSSRISRGLRVWKGGQGGCERRIEVFVKLKKKSGGGRVGGGGGLGVGEGSGWM